MFRSLRAQLWLSYAFLIVIALAVVGFALMLFLLRNPLVNRQAFLKIRAAETVLSSQSQPADKIQEVAQVFEVRALLFSSSGQLIKDSADGLPAISLPSNPLNLRSIGIQRDVSGRPWFYSVKHLPDGNWLLTAAVRPRVLPLLAVLTDELSAPFLEGAIIALLLSLLLAFVIARWVADPLEQIISAAGSMPTAAAYPVVERGPHEVRELTHAFNSMVRRIRSSQDAQRDFVANVSHELKTPLTSIQGFAQALMDGTADTPDAQRQAAEIIYNEAARMHRMALDLLDLAKLDGGTAELKVSSVDLATLLRGIAAKFQPIASRTGVELRVTLPENLTPVMGDGDRLAQVFNNLVDNAMKFTPRGGTVTVRAMEDRREIQVSVNDTGKGIALAAIPHIFERFYRADAARAGGNEHGAGLGLAIAHEIVKAHGGRISVRSEEGRGSGFVVHLPLLGSGHG